MFDFFALNWEVAWSNLIRVLIACALAFPIGWERSHSARSLGLRTFPLVSVASCGYMLLAIHAPGTNAETVGRVLQGLLAGIGFIGGGAILKNHNSVVGLATAASIWNTGAVGAAVAYQRVEIALVLSVTNFLLLRLFTPLSSSDKYGDEVDTLPRDEA